MSTQRTTRASSSTPQSNPTIKTTTSTSALPPRKSTAPAATTTTKSKPLWSSSKVNTATTVSTPAKKSLLSKRSITNLGFNKPPAVTASLLHSININKIIPSVDAQTMESENKPRVELLDKRNVKGYNPSREPIQAYLRIRPGPLDAPNYIQIANDTEVLMVPPADHRLNPSTSSSIFGGPLLRSAAMSLNPLSHPSGSDSSTPHPAIPFGTLYKFTKVFSPSIRPPIQLDDPNSQENFFKETTLPLVKDVLDGQNCLLFAYGPTGSGKTWTVQGEGEDAGLLPRAMDVIWRSVEGKESKSMFRPTRLAGIEMTPPTQRISPPSTMRGTDPSRLAALKQSSFSSDPLGEIIQVDDAYEYSIWISYAEIYNEKIYDLLESPLPTPINSSSSSSSHSLTPASIFHAGLGFLNASGAKAKAMGLKGLQSVKRNALSLKHDSQAGNKYVHGMKEVRVHSAEEAKALLARGQVNRRVFSTLANRVSSRSHSVFTIKVIRVLKGADSDDMSSATSSRFSIVDLAGSERVVNTQTSGERLKEAGNINKSLMVLGQCMEVLRKNQELDAGHKPALVPFRHSKLTELFQSFFVGDGKAVMIVNVNPFETGFDENSHVMKFSAVAKELMTVKNSIPAPITPIPAVLREPRIVRLSMIVGGEEQDILYEEEEEDDDEQDEFVNALLDELTNLRTALFETEMGSIMAVSQMKAKIVKEYEVKLSEMERRYQEQAMDDAKEAEMKMNAKLDILVRLGNRTAAAAALVSPVTEEEEEDEYDDDDEEEEDEKSTSDEEEDEDEAAVEKMLLDAVVDGPEFEDDVGDRSASVSPSQPSPSLFVARAQAHARTTSGSLLEIESPSRISPVQIFIQEESIEITETFEDFNLEGNDDEEEEEGEEDEDEDEEDDEDEEVDNGDDSLISEDFEVSIGGDSSFAQSSSEEEEEEEYIPVVTAPRKSRASGASMKSIRKAQTPKKIVEVEEEEEEEMVLPKKMSKKVAADVKEIEGDKENHKAVEEEHDEDEDGDFGMKKSIVKNNSNKIKKKRKLGGQNIRDVEDIDAIADSFSPATLPSLHSSKSLGRASSVRSMKR